MPPDASSFPDSGSNFTDTSTSVNGPAGATITLNSFLVARCNRAFLPTGAPGNSSTPHWPPTCVQPSIPFVSKSNFCSVTPSAILISGGAACTLRGEPRPYAPSAVNATSNSLLRDMSGSCTAGSLIQLLRYVLPIISFHQRHVGHGMPVFQRGHDTDDAESGVLLRGLRRCSLEGSLRLSHRLALSLRRREIVAAGDRLGLRHLARPVIHNHFGELVALHCVNGQLELSVLHFILRRNRLAFLHACGKSTLQRDLCIAQRFGQLGMLCVAGILRPTHWRHEHPRHKEHQPKGRLFHGLAPSFYFMVALGLPLQYRIQAVEDRHATLEQVLVIRSGLGEALDREVDPRRLAARELAVVQVRLVHELGDDPGPAVLDAEPLDEGLERTILAVMPELRTEHVEGNAFAGRDRKSTR